MSQLIQLDESLYEMDKTKFRFAWSDLEEEGSTFRHIKSIMPSTMAERRGAILATITLHLLQCIRKQKFPQITRPWKTDNNLRPIRNAPWTLQQRFMAIKSLQSELDKNDASAAVPIEYCFDRNVRWYFLDKMGLSRDCKTLFSLIYVLDRLPTFLKHAAENDDLIIFARRHTIFPQEAFHFPQLLKHAQKAVNAYFAKFPATPPANLLPESFSEGPYKRSESKLHRKCRRM